MLRSLKEILGYRLKVLDGEIGKCKDFIFDSQKWVIRYVLADTEGWLTDRQVLISPAALGQPQWAERVFPINLKKNKIANSPELNHDVPISRRYEIAVYEYYGWPHYWKGQYLWGQQPNPWPFYEEVSLKKSNDEDNYDPEFRVVSEAFNYRVMTSDEKFGEIHDIIVNDENWSISHIVVDFGSPLSGKKVLIEPGSISNFESHLCLNVNSDELKEFPKYNSHNLVNTEFEAVKYDFKGRPH
jgi:hypothetical protein